MCFTVAQLLELALQAFDEITVVWGKGTREATYVPELLLCQVPPTHESDLVRFDRA